jgi:UPF0755 protein
MPGPTRKPKRPARRKRTAASETKPPASRALRAAKAVERHPGLLYGGAGALAAIALAALALNVVYGRSRGPNEESAMEVDWPADLDADAAAELLASLGIVKNPSTMALFLKATGGTSSFVPGPHFLYGGATPWEIRHNLTRYAYRHAVKVTIPEGWNRFDIAARLEKLRVAGRRAFLNATADGLLLDRIGIEKAGGVGAESAEGYLFPATYELPLDSDPHEVVTRLVAEADKRWQTLAGEHQPGLASLQGSLGFGRREILTLASMIEKEAVVDEERPLIASVFLNRLIDPEFKSHKLQSDPTSMYGCLVAPEEIPSCAGYAGKATHAINTDPKNRYSTYVNHGLPPGPIANPGARSIEAVLAPAATRFYYFVAAGNGRHTFSESYDAHKDAIGKRATATP